MTPERWRVVRELFTAAAERDASSRASFLATACRDDSDLHAEVTSLLEASDGAGHFLESGVAERSAPVRIGPYHVVSEIGHGGMGTVYLAARDDEEYEKRVAIKLVRPGLYGDVVLHRFRSERQILARLEHPNIARLLEGGTTEDGLPYLVMEYVEGRHLLEDCDARRLSIAKRLELFRQVCSAVQYAHRHLVVHRDIKPSNLLVTPEGVPKLLDFGVAKLLDAEGPPGDDGATVTSFRLLTPDYASPEQLLGQPITTASDVFSLGLVLYELLTGHRARRPSAESGGEAVRAPERPGAVVFRMTGTGTPEVVAAARGLTTPELSRRLEGDLDNIVLMALRRDPARRYSSPEQLSDDLRRYLEGLPVSARGDAFRYRAGKFLARHKAAVLASAAVAAALVVGFGAAVWQARVARAERELAQQRFEDVRHLAHTVMYELHDGIEPLPGSTPVRGLLVRTALKYLNGLAADATNDPSLLRELGDAYKRIGEVQGGTNQGNLGDTGGALRTYRTALFVRERLAGLTASADDRARLAESLMDLTRALLRSSNVRAARAYIGRCVAICEELLAKEPGVIRRTEDLAKACHTLGDVLSEEGDLPAAIEVFTREAALQESALARAPDARHRRNAAIAHFKLGSILAVAGKPASALSHLERAVATAEELLHAEPGNAGHQRLLTFTLDAAADSLYALGQTAPAFEMFARALSLRETMIAADPANANLRMHLGILYGRYGSLLARSGRREEGLAMGRKAIPVLERVAAEDPRNVNASYETANALRRLGESTEPAFETRADGATGRKSWADASAIYRKSLGALEDLSARGLLLGLHAREPVEVSAALARCEKALAQR
jgi:serine/threonine protein kinase